MGERCQAQERAMVPFGGGDPLAFLAPAQLNRRLANRQQFSKGDGLTREADFAARLPLKALEPSLTPCLARGVHSSGCEESGLRATLL